MMMSEKVVTMIGLLYFWDIKRGEVETFSICPEKLKENNDFTNLYFTETP